MTAPVSERFVWFGKPDRLWDLWDLIDKNASDIGWLMSFGDAFLRNVRGQDRPNSQPIPLDRPVKESSFGAIAAADLYKAMRLFKQIGAGQSASQINRALYAIEHQNWNWNILTSSVMTTVGGFADELKKQKCLLLTEEESNQFKSKKPFGAKVYDQFPSSRNDVIEATRSLAVCRWPASVFHLLRASEWPLKATLVAVSPSALIPAKPTARVPETWGEILLEIQKEAYKNVNQGKKAPEIEKFGRVVCGYLESLKKIRDSRTMHVDEPLPDMSLARGLYGRVKDLMVHLAEHLDEQGNFTP